MKVILLALVILTQCACNPFGCPEGEPRYFAEIGRKTVGETFILEITFNQRLAECVNGFESDDFAWTRVHVEKPKLNDISLKEAGNSNGMIYSVETKDKSAYYSLLFSLNGKTYESDQTTIENYDNKTRISMKRQEKY